MTTKTRYIQRYYDTHKVEGEEVGQSFFHYTAIQNLIAILKWLFYRKPVGVVSDINLYITANPKEVPLAPDVAIIDNLDISKFDRETGQSYYIGEDGSPPRVVIEVASRDTWRNDLKDKPDKYAALGVIEYFAFDPNLPTFWTKEWKLYDRLIGWRLDDSGGYSELPKQAGRLWSVELDSWLVVEGYNLQFYTVDGQVRVDEVEATQLQAEAERQLANERAEAERQRAEKLADLLRQKGFNPADFNL